MLKDWLVVFPPDKWAHYLEQRKFSLDQVIKDNPKEISDKDRFFICVSSPVNRIVGGGLILEHHLEGFIFTFRLDFKFNVKHFIPKIEWESHGIPFDDIDVVFPDPGGIRGIDKNSGDKIINALETKGPKPLEFDKVVAEIKKFKLPKRQLKIEESYHLSLYAWLKKSFSSAKIEEQRSGTRPDISIDDIAIEVKGPTKNPDLNSIANKCLIYPQYFPDGLIIVLFDVNVGNRRYNEWLEGMRRTHPDARVIRK